jgi:hypothetical protein
MEEDCGGDQGLSWAVKPKTERERDINMVYGSISPWHGVSSDCGWRRRPRDKDGNCEFIE